VEIENEANIHARRDHAFRFRVRAELSPPHIYKIARFGWYAAFLCVAHGQSPPVTTLGID